MDNQQVEGKKPIYKKKWFLITVGIIIVISLLPKGNTNKNDSVDSQSSKTEESSASENKVPKSTLRDTLNLTLNSIKEVNDSYFSELKEQRISEGVDKFNSWVEVLNRCEKSNDVDIVKESKVMRKKIQDVQVKYFPVLRKNYAEFARVTFFESNIDVSFSGRGNSTISFVGGLLSSNKNIADIQKKLSEMLHKLRFKESQYKWYKYDSGYSYTIESPTDKELL